MTTPQYQELTVSVTSPDAAGSAAAATRFENLRRFQRFVIDAALIGATGGTLDIYLQRKVGATWVDWYKFPQLLAAASAVRTTLDCDAASQVAETAVGTGSSPVLAASKLTCRHPGDEVRVWMVAGVSTSAGAAVSITLTGLGELVS